MKGYWNQPEETAQALRRDAAGRVWFYTGDVARVDEDGFTTIVQRKKDMIIVDGFNVYPSEVEDVLYAHPAVRLAAVIGVPDAYHGEVVKACVVLRQDPAASIPELTTHCAAKLAEYKLPREIEIRDSLPMSAVGKILYRVLREEQQAKSVRGGRWCLARFAMSQCLLASDRFWRGRARAAQDGLHLHAAGAVPAAEAQLARSRRAAIRRGRCRRAEYGARRGAACRRGRSRAWRRTSRTWGRGSAIRRCSSGR